MQRPPGPHILTSRSAYEWINRVGQKHKRLVALEPSPEDKDALDGWVATEFVYSTLSLDGVSVPREKVEGFASRPTDLTELGEEDLVIAELLEALRTIASLVATFGAASGLAPDVLIRLRNPLGGTEGFRSSAGDQLRPFKPIPPDKLTAAIETACRWFRADSFVELNPVEQASIAYLRLVEFQPFEESSDRTSLVAASLFTMRKGLPPVIIRPEMREKYRAAIDEARRMNTAPTVELMAEAVEQSLDGMISLVEARKRK